MYYQFSRFLTLTLSSSVRIEKICYTLYFSMFKSTKATHLKISSKTQILDAYGINSILRILL